MRSDLAIRARHALILLAALALASGCKESSKGKAPDPTPIADDGNPGSPGGETKPPRRAAPLPVADIQALVDRWLATQNAGDFAAYQTLYAQRFEGVRRSGTRVVRLDRAGWLADRQRMFRKPMKVELNDVVLDPFIHSATVRFTQQWASGKYEDIGPKQLVVVKEGDALRIGREEMLSSTVLSETRETDLASNEFAFVIELPARSGPEGVGRAYVVLDALGDRETGALTLIDSGDPVIVKAALAPEAIAKELASWRGQRLRTGDCVATVGEIAAISRVVPHFGERQVWSGMDGEGTPYTEAEIAEAAFHESSAVVVGELRFEDSACKPGVFARSAALPALAEAGVVADENLERAAVRAFRRLASHQDIQKEYAASPGGDEGVPWDMNIESGMNPAAAGPRVTLYRHPTRDVTWAAVGARAGAGCGSFGASLWALFKVEAAPGKTPRFELLAEQPSNPDVLAVIDTDGDGTLELVIERDGLDTALISANGDELRLLSIPYFDCGC